MKKVSVREFDNVVDVRVAVPDSVSYLVDVPAATTALVYITMKQNIIGTYDGMSSDSVVFTVNAGDDTVVRTLGSWIEDGFDVGMTITCADTVSNNASYTIAAVTEKVLTLDSGDTVVAETIAGNVPTITGAIADADWVLHATVAASTHKFEALEYGPTGLRFTRSAGTGTVRAWVKG